MIWVIQPNSERFSWPSQQYNQIVERFTPAFRFLYDTSPEKQWQKDELQESVVSGSNTSREIQEYWRHWDLISFSVTQIPRSRMKGPWEREPLHQSGRELKMEDAVG